MTLDATPFEAKYVGCDRIGFRENMSWLLDIPSEEIIEKVAKGNGSLRECLTMEMATKWAPPVKKGEAAKGDDSYPPGKERLARATRNAALKTNPYR